MTLIRLQAMSMVILVCRRIGGGLVPGRAVCVMANVKRQLGVA